MLKSTDFKENDKLILLYSLEYGKISVHAKGIRKGTAKLKFAADQFCFGQYELAEKGGRYTLKTCQQEVSFYNLREDIVCYYGGCTVAECLMNLTEEGQSDPKIFVMTLRVLTALSQNISPLIAVLKFLLSFLECSGYKLDLSACSSCGEKSKKMYLDLSRGGAVCENCRQSDSITIPPRTATVCQMVSDIKVEKLKYLDINGEMLKEALTLCHRYISHSFMPLKSLIELIKLA